MITRSNPDVGYISKDVYEAYAFSQTIRAGNQIYLSGIAPLRGGDDDIELVGEGELIMAAELVTPEVINFMVSHARGPLNVPADQQRIEALGLEMMPGGEAPRGAPATGAGGPGGSSGAGDRRTAEDTRSGGPGGSATKSPSKSAEKEVSAR